MRLLFTLSLFLFSLISFSQTSDSLKTISNQPSNFASFVTKLDIANATKDGIYLNGYVVNIGRDQLKKLNGKKIRVAGKVTVLKGLKKIEKEHNENANEVIRQGRENDTKYIEFPKIEIVRD